MLFYTTKSCKLKTSVSKFWRSTASSLSSTWNNYSRTRLPTKKSLKKATSLLVSWPQEGCSPLELLKNAGYMQRMNILEMNVLSKVKKINQLKMTWRSFGLLLKLRATARLSQITTKSWLKTKSLIAMLKRLRGSNRRRSRIVMIQSPNSLSRLILPSQICWSTNILSQKFAIVRLFMATKNSGIHQRWTRW